MMTNLFSIFDPSCSFFIPMNWLAVNLCLCLVPMIFWAGPNRGTLLFSKLVYGVHSEFKVLIGPQASLGHTLLFVSLLVFIAVNNFMGLFPYIFTCTSHLSLTLTLSLPLWVSFMIYGWINHTQHMLAHLVPLGTPGVLMPFMVLIETISNIIRPGTLAVRLTANMIAGHLLLVLLGNQGVSASYSLLGVLVVVQILLLTLESAVALIQSYVFAVLTSLYSSEVSYVKSFY